MAAMPTGDEIDVWFKSITADLGLGEPGHSHDPHSAISHVLNVARRNGTPYQPKHCGCVSCANGFTHITGVAR